MADTRATKQLVRRRAERIHTEAVRRVLEELADVVPDSDAARSKYPAGAYPQRQPKLRTSQQVTTSSTDTRFTTSVRYTAPQADFTETGTAPHTIHAKAGGLLRFYWLKVEAYVAFPKVNHPGSHKHDGWFSRTVAKWPDRLRQARTSTN